MLDVYKYIDIQPVQCVCMCVHRLTGMERWLLPFLNTKIQRLLFKVRNSTRAFLVSQAPAERILTVQKRNQEIGVPAMEKKVGRQPQIGRKASPLSLAGGRNT